MLPKGKTKVHFILHCSNKKLGYLKGVGKEKNLCTSCPSQWSVHKFNIKYNNSFNSSGQAVCHL